MWTMGMCIEVEEFEFTEGIFDPVKLFSDAGYLIFMVTNPSGRVVFAI